MKDPSNPSVTNGSGLGLSAGQSQSRNIGLLLQAQYEFLDRYIINVNGRLDGNSKFSPDNRFGLFPGISTRWRISGEPFMRGWKIVPSCRGVTLLEVLIVVVIVAIGVAAITPMYVNYTGKNRLKMASETLYNDLKRAQGEALKTNASVNVVFQTGSSW